jgi:hypothetical protein
MHTIIHGMSKSHSDIILSLSSFSSSKSTLISKNILDFPFNPSFRYTCYYLCFMCDEADCVMATSFCGFCLLLQGNHCNFGEILLVYYRNQDYSNLEILQDTMKVTRGRVSMAPLVPNLSTRWR